MLTYDISNINGPIYKALYQAIKEDILAGKLKINEKMPSKRTLANNLGISTITVENSYDQLISEGYLYSIEKKGYFVADMKLVLKNADVSKPAEIHIKKPAVEKYRFDFASNNTESENFPFSVWAKVSREVLSKKQQQLLTISPSNGVEELRNAIAHHLLSFRGISVNPDQIVVGAGTEYLYSLLIKLLGEDKIFCIENPGYTKLKQVYESNNVKCVWSNLDDKGLNVEELEKTGAGIAHISPNHHFPTGITMPVPRRYELLAWANKKDGRYIIEDDYDSEFRQNGNPIPPLLAIDGFGKVIYMNTFSKSLTSTIRISYMVLPQHLADLFYEKLSFYSCTVSTFEQYTLAQFISQGYFEKHINRMRLHYGRKRTHIQELLNRTFTMEECRIIENDSGLHFILQFNSRFSDNDLQQKLKENGIKIHTVSDYDMEPQKNQRHQFILNYSNINMGKLETALEIIKGLLN